ncbi:FG-GAP repeat domain-containing protein [Streptomyces sp. NPDC056503]|uniref:FG-GAP repeat domain-containing protein n=1 Tax=Streptomyces sp. NPDC056503 TaxID=3345842 RepID=UPI003678276E
MHIAHARPRARRLAAAAVTVVLAATGGTLTTLPATAAPVATQDERQTAVEFPRDADVVGAGPSGFLSKSRGDTREFRWTRYADGTRVVLPGAAAAAGGADLVVTGDRAMLTVSSVLTVHDMAKADAAPVTIDLDALGDYMYTGLAGDTLLLGRYEGDHQVQYAATLDAETLAGGAPKLRKLVGGPSMDCQGADEGWADSRSALYDCSIDGGVTVKVLVDAATGKNSWFTRSPGELPWWGGVSATHVAWRESRSGGSGVVAVRRDAPAQEQWIPDAGEWSDPLYVVGGWLASGQKAHIEQSTFVPGGHNPTKRPFVLQSIADPREKVVALTAYSSAVAGPDGSLLVRGGTPEHGEGLYRISPRADGGRPTVEQVASTGQSTVVTLLGSSLPNELTGDRVARGVDLGWDLSRGDSEVWLTVTHLPSRTTVHDGWDKPAGTVAGTPRRIAWHWDGKDLEARDWDAPARNGAYEWTLTARPDEGIGPELVATGRFSVSRPAAAHDYDDDGAADLLTRDPEGVLWRYGTRPTAPGGSVTDTGGSRVGGGWKAYDRLVSVGNVAGSSAPDSVARDRSGVLWLYRGTGDRTAPLAARTQVGGGWQAYDRITGGADVTGDGRSDLLATDKTGVLWLYPGTGNTKAPFSARKRIGAGWGGYNELTAAGNLGGAKAGDLLARDKDGVLWLYLGKGDGTFAARKRVGGGWGAFKGLTGVGDANGDGRADLIAWNGDETFYAGTGDWAAPFKRGAKVGLTQDSAYDSLF